MTDRTIDSLRTPEAVIVAVHLPKTGIMRSVLSTIQPDQYRLITAPSDESLVVQGLPGTGKTVIAIHRAAFLTDPEREGGPLSRVLVVGPTDQYIEHVSTVLDGIAKGDVQLISVSGLVDASARLEHIQRDTSAGREGISNSKVLWDLVFAATRTLSASGILEGGRTKRANRLLKSLKSRDVLIGELSTDSALWEWLSEIGPNKDVRSDARLRPLMAAINVALGEDHPFLFDHIIVDEAQDLSPIEWHLVTKRLKRNGRLTLFGDLNQRHNALGVRDWASVFKAAEMPLPEIQTIDTGFRTTRQILNFANQFLDTAVELPLFLREGPEPEELRVLPNQILKKVFQTAEGVARQVSPGSVAIISNLTSEVDDYFLGGGWRRTGAHSGWQKDAMTIVNLIPSNARGLEFDGVVVVEPSDLVGSMGQGMLYTTFTRPTGLLKIVSTRDWR